jgi:hypothetical protein
MDLLIIYNVVRQRLQNISEHQTKDKKTKATNHQLTSAQSAHIKVKTIRLTKSNLSKNYNR